MELQEYYQGTYTQASKGKICTQGYTWTMNSTNPFQMIAIPGTNDEYAQNFTNSPAFL